MLLCSCTSKGGTLFSAAATGNLNKVRELISSGVNVNGRDSDGMTALMIASQNGYIDIVKELLEAGANISMKDDNGKTASDYAIENKKFDLLPILYGAVREYYDNEFKKTPF